MSNNGELTNILKHETKKEYFITQKRKLSRMKLHTEKWENNIEILNINHNYNNAKIWLYRFTI